MFNCLNQVFKLKIEWDAYLYDIFWHHKDNIFDSSKPSNQF